MTADELRMAVIFSLSRRGCDSKTASLAALAMHPIDDWPPPGQAFAKAVRKQARQVARVARSARFGALRSIALETLSYYKSLAIHFREVHYIQRYDEALAGALPAPEPPPPPAPEPPPPPAPPLPLQHVAPPPLVAGDPAGSSGPGMPSSPGLSREDDQWAKTELAIIRSASDPASRRLLLAEFAPWMGPRSGFSPPKDPVTVERWARVAEVLMARGVSDLLALVAAYLLVPVHDGHPPTSALLSRLFAEIAGQFARGIDRLPLDDIALGKRLSIFLELYAESAHDHGDEYYTVWFSGVHDVLPILPEFLGDSN